MATELQYKEAIIRVKNGTHTKADLDLVEKAAKQAGSLGDEAREALKKL